MTASPFAAVLTSFRREPSRTPSMIVTIYGDAIAPRGGSVWLGTLTTILAELGIADGAVRTAMSRLTADGWLDRSRVGRNSFYRLAEKGRSTFAAATEHIYDPPEPVWDGRLALLFAPGADEAAWREAGFGQPAPGVWLAPSTFTPPAEAGQAIRLEGTGQVGDMARLAARAWRLDRTAEGYRHFISAFGPLVQAFASGRTLPDLDNLLIRILLIHAYRRVILRDPILPGPLLPADWPGIAARRVCGTLYRTLLGPSERWLDRHALDEAGPLPPAGASLQARFAAQHVTDHLDLRTEL